MKVAILAGGVGSRLAEETEIKPKPMVEIGGRPILWHIMMHYAHYGFNEFVIALGYKGEVIKKYMVDYCSLNSNLTVNLRSGEVKFNGGHKPNWTVELVDTGISTLTGGRIKRLAPYLGNETFMLTWGDGVSNVNLPELLAFHRGHGKLATLTIVHPPARFGHLELNDDKIRAFLKSHRPAKAGSMVRSLSWSRMSLVTLMVMIRSGKKSRLSTWQKMGNLWLTVIPRFGSVWIRCGISDCSKASGRVESVPGKYGRKHDASVLTGHRGYIGTVWCLCCKWQGIIL